MIFNLKRVEFNLKRVEEKRREEKSVPTSLDCPSARFSSESADW